MTENSDSSKNRKDETVRREPWMSDQLYHARLYEEISHDIIAAQERPGFHLSVQIGWMNDPNGFVLHDGVYHMFYQYHPYDSFWGPMHWGHAVSRDLLHWEYRPCALAPDKPYDRDGCFSGSSVFLPDGRQMLMYTGVDRGPGAGAVPAPEEEKIFEDAKDTMGLPHREFQTQNLAFGDGINFEKYGGNPVLTREDLPEEADPSHFRDPKMVRWEDGTWRMFAVTRMKKGGGAVLQYVSRDAIHWSFRGILDENRGRFGRMWECPDFFELDGRMVLIGSAQDMLARGLEYRSGNGTFVMTGTYDDETGRFTEEKNHSLDYGIDFYAPQTVLTQDGRRVMIGWMQNWDSVNLRTDEYTWFGQMSLPRELNVRGDGTILQKPVREIIDLRENRISLKDVVLEDEERFFEGIRGRKVDMEVEMDAAAENEIFDSFTIRFAQNENFYSFVEFRTADSTVSIDRRYCGTRRAIVNESRCIADHDHGHLKMRLILDRFSAELFIGEGEKVMSMVVPTRTSADAISFCAKGRVKFSVEFYTLK